MLGRQVNGTAQRGGVVATAPFAPMGAQPIKSSRGAGNSMATDDAHDAATPWVLLGLVILFIAWALIEMKQRVRDQVNPRNIALNVRNLAAILLPVIVGLALLKIALAKLMAWFGDVPVLGTGLAVLTRIVGMV